MTWISLSLRCFEGRDEILNMNLVDVHRIRMCQTSISQGIDAGFESKKHYIYLGNRLKFDLESNKNTHLM